MPFLADADYTPHIKADQLAILTGGSVPTRETAERFAQATIETHLRGRYDVVAIFAATGSARSAEIVRYYIDLTLYELYSRINPQQIADLRVDRRNAAISWLRDVRDAKMSVDLPPTTAVTTIGLNYGSTVKFSQEYDRY